MNAVQVIKTRKARLVWLGLGLWTCAAWAGGARDLTTNNVPSFGEPIQHWLVLKPIPVGESKRAVDEPARRRAFGRDWLASAGGESGVQPQTGTKVRVAGRALRWSPLELNRGLTELLVNGRPVENALAYAWTEFEAPGSGAAVLGVGSDDSVKVWLNGKLVHENWIGRGVKLDDDLVPVELRPGKNQLLLKVQNDAGSSGFACRVLSPAQAEGLRNARMQNPAVEPCTDEQLKRVLSDYLDVDRLGVGMVVGLLDEHGTRIISHGRLAEGSTREPDGDTLFEIGSVTKVFTALLLQDMVERGEMRLDDPVQKYLPATVKLPTRGGKPITLLHLATHTSGLPRDVNNATPHSWRDPGAGYTLQQFYACLSRCKLRSVPGAKEEYSNLGVELLGHVIELKAGRDYESLVLERICRPLGMNSTRIHLTPELKARLARGHVLPGYAACNEDFSVLPAAGSIKSTANDLLKFVAAYSGLTASPLAPLMEKAQAEHALGPGRKRRLVWSGEGPVFEHGGLTFGYKTELAFDKSKRRGVVILSNCGSSSLVDDCWRALLEGRWPVPARTAHVDASGYEKYVGLYQTERQEQCVVRRQGERLLVRWLGKPGERNQPASFEIFPQGESVFCNRPWWHKQSVQLSFASRNDETRMVLATSQFCLEALRVSTNAPATPPPLRLEAALCERYAGRYRVALFGLKLGPTVHIVHERDDAGEHLVAFVSGWGKQLFIKSGGAAGGEIFPLNETTFFVPYTQVPVRGTVVRNTQGKPSALVIELGTMKLKAKRVGK